MQYQLEMREQKTGQVFEREIPANSKIDAQQYAERLSHTDGEWEIISLVPVVQKRRCHYCGCDAKSGAFGFFDEPVCEDCGG